MARGPGSVTGIPPVNLISPDGKTVQISGYDITSAGFVGDRPSLQVSLTAKQQIVYKGQTYKFEKWNLSGVIPEGLDAYTPNTISSPYDDAGGKLDVTADYVLQEEYGTVIIEPSSDPPEGGIATASVTSWTGKIGSSFDSVLVAKAYSGYAFLRWSDGGSKTHTITETVLSTGTRYVRPIAYFRKTTKLILRSANSGLILRGSNGKILRDE